MSKNQSSYDAKHPSQSKEAMCHVTILIRSTFAHPVHPRALYKILINKIKIYLLGEAGSDIDTLSELKPGSKKCQMEFW